MRALFLLLLPLCCSCQQYTIFVTADTYYVNSTKSPDTICAESDGQESQGFEYRAVVTLSNRRHHSDLFISGYEFTNHDGTPIFNFDAFFPCGENIYIYATNGTNNRTLVNCSDEFLLWSGWSNLTTNCLDFTTPNGSAAIGNLSAAKSTDVALGLCVSSYHYLCARGDNFSLPRKDVVVFLSNSPVTPRNAGTNFDPDEFCREQAQSSPFYLLKNNASEVQAVAFTAERQNLNDMFNGTGPIYDLDGNVVVVNSTDLFHGVAQTFLRDSNGTLQSDNTQFWTGAAGQNGTAAGVTCGDYTGGISDFGGYGTIQTGIYNGTGRPCTLSARFLCAVNVNPPPPPPVEHPRSTIVFFTDSNEIRLPANPDAQCRSSAANSLIPSGYFIFALTSKDSLCNDCGPVEDLAGNFLGNTLTSFLTQSTFTTRSLTTANGTHVDIDQPFWFKVPNLDCENFMSNTSIGSLGRTLKTNDIQKRCDSFASFLCAATPGPRANGTYTGNGTVVVVAGNGTNGTIQVTIPPGTGLPNGTVVVVILGNNNNTISTVVLVVFLNGTGGVVEVTNLTNPITITFPIRTSLDDVTHCVGDGFAKTPLLPQCGFRNASTDKWETNGCFVSSINSSFVRCSCTHLTDFAILAPKSNKIVPTDTLELTPDNIAAHSTGLIAVMVILAIFLVVFALAWRRDRIEAAAYIQLRDEKQVKWADFAADRKKSTFVKQIKIAFQKRHTWFSLIFRKTGTSFKSVDHTYVALLSVFASMSMSALFHAQSNNDIAKAVAWVCTVCVCLVPSQILMALFVHTGEMGFYEEWEYVTARRHNRCTEHRFPESWRYVWRAVTLLSVIGMIVSVLTMSMRFDLQPFYYCQGAPAQAWVVSWLSAYAITVFGYEPIRRAELLHGTQQ